MEFKALKNIESSFRQIRLYAIIFLGCCMLLTVLVVWRSYSFAEAQRQKIYVLDQGRSLMLLRHGNMSDVFTCYSSISRRIKALLKAILQKLFCWPIKAQ